MGQNSKILNVHIYPSHLTNESRIIREAKSLIKLGLVDKVAVVGYWKEGLKTNEEIGPGITFHRLKPWIAKQSGGLKIFNIFSFPFFYLSIFRFCMAHKPSVVNLHTLTVLPLGFWLKKYLKCKLIYDPHELETETNESKGLRQQIGRKVESAFIGYCGQIIVVGELIRQWYEKRYGLKNIAVVKNIPEVSMKMTKSSILRSTLKVKEHEIFFLYVGVMEHGRGIPLLIEVFRQMPLTMHIGFMGYGSYSLRIQAAAKDSKNIHYLPAVPPQQVVEYVSGADVGICLIENTCLSYYYCLPNKSFEYLAAGIPFISSDFPELMNEFQDSGVCWFSSLDEPSLIQLFNTITFETIRAKRNNVLHARKEWTWEKEEKKYLTVYQKM